MPIYEFSCPKCRTIFNFLSKRVNPRGAPTCPKCGSRHMVKQMSLFSLSRGNRGADEAAAEPDFDDPRVLRAMSEMEKDMDHLDEQNPKHMAYMMRKMKDIMPPGATARKLEVAIKRLESGENPEKIEEDMGEILGAQESPGASETYTHDSGLYDL